LFCKFMFTSFKRIFKSGWNNLFRDGGLVAATLFILVMTISAITALYLFFEVSQFMISSIQDRVDLAVYFKEEILEDAILDAKDEIAEIPEVKEVQYVSKEVAFEKFSERHKDDPILMESLAEVGGNPFAASLEIKAFEASQYEIIVASLERANFSGLVSKIDYYQRRPVIEKISSLSSALNKSGIAFSVILAVFSILVAFNTIRLAIYSSREEIKIQRLVGASNWFIRGPFLAQGAIAGFFAVLICLFLFFLLCWGLDSKVDDLFPGLSLLGFFISHFWLIVVLQLFSGVGLGIASSLIAVRRYLRV
jgi:cell division transport system permease protein